MIHKNIAEHLDGIAAKAYPEAHAKDGVTVRCFGGEAVYDRNKGRDVIASETIKTEIFVSSDKPLDHLAMVRLLPRTEVNLNATMVWRVYRRHTTYDHLELNELKRVSFNVDFTYDIKEGA